MIFESIFYQKSQISRFRSWCRDNKMVLLMTLALLLLCTFYESSAALESVINMLFEYCYLLEIFYGYIAIYPQRKFGVHMCFNIFIKYFSRFLFLEIVLWTYNFAEFLNLTLKYFAPFMIAVYLVPRESFHRLYQNELLRTLFLNMSAAGNGSINTQINEFVFQKQIHILQAIEYIFLMQSTVSVYYILDYIDPEARPQFDFYSALEEAKYYLVGSLLSLFAHNYLQIELNALLINVYMIQGALSSCEASEDQKKIL